MLKPANPNLDSGATPSRQAAPAATQAEKAALADPEVTPLHGAAESQAGNAPSNRPYAQTVRGQIQRVRLDLLARENERLDHQVHQLLEQQRDLLQRLEGQTQEHQRDRQRREHSELKLAELSARLERVTGELSRQADEVAAVKAGPELRDTVKPLLLAVLEMLGDSDQMPAGAAAALLKGQAAPSSRPPAEPIAAMGPRTPEAPVAATPTAAPKAPAEPTQAQAVPQPVRSAPPAAGPASQARPSAAQIPGQIPGRPPAATPGPRPVAPTGQSAAAASAQAGTAVSPPSIQSQASGRPQASGPRPASVTPGAGRPQTAAASPARDEVSGKVLTATTSKSPEGAPKAPVNAPANTPANPPANAPANAPAKTAAATTTPHAILDAVESEVSGSGEKPSLDDEVAIEIARLLMPKELDDEPSSEEPKSTPLLLGTSETPAVPSEPNTEPARRDKQDPEESVVRSMPPAKRTSKPGESPASPSRSRISEVSQAAKLPRRAHYDTPDETLQNDPLPKCLTERWDDSGDGRTKGEAAGHPDGPRDKNAFRWPFRRLRAAMDHDHAMAALQDADTGAKESPAPVKKAAP